ncbi:dTDP-4-dehydrorhamnose 3,5-epimerase [Paraburkholderia sp. BL6665CI2N2]|uniref:dTDP-4-dehydrorhamnose 3,5-epimerase n=1 Tax=Paraburkholderia sp. BL6665CI2N2 TaxID=1938806 RepID=UPI001065AD3D|nr:dTDP-4-dehydrorhamnose 3,5-epimerase [Paraburkholderia sp. BL6665CI2N2]TDY17042.1 dTDP-4-dehydrorhamnose 3,5-epimerase [Paraburkholderia sp. BL6665CI2N2]
MTINVKHTAIHDVKLIEPKAFGDARGAFFESFNQNEFEDKVARGFHFVQDYHSIWTRRVLRGLHYQIQRPQGKLVRVVAGEVFDVAVDLRRWSPTFGRWVGARLSAANRHQLWIPPGFAHGFVVLSDVAEFLCKTTDFWFPEHERTLLWNDPDIGIEWDIDGMPLVAANDAEGVNFNSAEVY